MDRSTHPSGESDEHQFRVVIQLDAQPVPAGLIFIELFRKEFVIHPRDAVHWNLRPFEIDRASHRKPGQ